MTAGLEKALKDGGDTHGLADVAEGIAAGRFRVWERDDTIVITEIIPTPKAVILHFWLATGEMEDVVKLVNEAIKKTPEATRATFIGRKGWSKVLDWKHDMLLYQKEL